MFQYQNFRRVHATLQPVLSIRPLVGWSITFYFFYDFIFLTSLLQPKWSYDPKHPHATLVAVYPALLFFYIEYLYLIFEGLCFSIEFLCFDNKCFCFDIEYLLISNVCFNVESFCFNNECLFRFRR